MSALRCLIVDDEPLARDHLVRLVEADDRLRPIGEAATGNEALSMFDVLDVDVIFLDIRMPGISGIEVAREILDNVRIVFTTAYEEFAVTAFELQALDYLLKPFSRKRFRQTVERLFESESVESPRRVEAALDTDTRLEFVTIRSRGRMQIVPVADIRWMEAADDYVAIHHGDSRHLINTTMALLEERLPESAFIRVHRSHIVRLDDVKQVDLLGGGRAEALLEHGERIPVSRSGLKRLRQAPGLL